MGDAFGCVCEVVSGACHGMGSVSVFVQRSQMSAVDLGGGSELATGVGCGEGQLGRRCRKDGPGGLGETTPSGVQLCLQAAL